MSRAMAGLVSTSPAARAWRRGHLLRSFAVATAAGLLLLAMADSAQAQRRALAEVKRVTGRAEIQPRGQTQWVPVVVGTRLADGDDIRAYAGASAEIDLPDGSTLFLAENSRMVVNKLEFGSQGQGRTALFHLVVGKVRAVVAQAAISLVRSRQSNFAISTPTAVAAARGTIFEVVYDAVQQVMRVAVLVKDPQKPMGIVSCTSFFNRFSSVLVREGLASQAKGTESCAPPIPIELLPDADLVGTLLNPVAPGSPFFDPVTVPVNLPGLTEPPLTFTAGGDGQSSPSTIGANRPPVQPASTPANP